MPFLATPLVREGVSLVVRLTELAVIAKPTACLEPRPVRRRFLGSECQEFCRVHRALDDAPDPVRTPSEEVCDLFGVDAVLAKAPADEKNRSSLIHRRTLLSG